jgi:hypothetical protein
MYLINEGYHKVRAKLVTAETVYIVHFMQVLRLFSPVVLCSGYFPIQKLLKM